MERMTRRDTDRGEFDREFWRRAGAEMRFAATWDMVLEADLFRGGMPLNPDYKDLFRILNEEQVDYLKTHDLRFSLFRFALHAGFMIFFWR